MIIHMGVTRNTHSTITESELIQIHPQSLLRHITLQNILVLKMHGQNH